MIDFKTQYRALCLKLEMLAENEALVGTHPLVIHVALLRLAAGTRYASIETYGTEIVNKLEKAMTKAEEETILEMVKEENKK